LPCPPASIAVRSKAFSAAGLRRIEWLRPFLETAMRRFAVLGVLLSAWVADASAQAMFDAQGGQVRVEPVLSGLEQPSAMAFLPDGRALLVERRGLHVDLVDLRAGTKAPLAGTPQALVGAASGVHDPRRPAALTGEDAGFHDIVLHPQFADNGWIYLSYSSGPAERSTTVVDRFRLRGHRLVDRERVFTANAWSEDRFHYGGRMVFQGRYLFLTVGDRHHQDRAQELSTHAGKILRLNDDGTSPADNPFVGRKDALPEIWSYGHRNPQGLLLDAASGELWAHEHGPLGGDELNLIHRGANYGWPVISHGWQYDGGPIGKGITREQGMEQPVWVWTPAIAPSGMVRYDGTRFPAWRGSLLIGSMAQRHLDRIVVRGGRVVIEERILDRSTGRIRLVAQSPEGDVYVGNDDGQLLRLAPATAGVDAAPR
jgi:aldose sugar dehydrogenase